MKDTTMPFVPNEPHTEENTRLETWFERDRARVALYSRNDVLLVEWIDGAVAEAVDDGTLTDKGFILGTLHAAGPLHCAALDYYLDNLHPKTGVSITPAEPEPLASYPQHVYAVTSALDIGTTDEATQYEAYCHADVLASLTAQIADRFTNTANVLSYGPDPDDSKTWVMVIYASTRCEFEQRTTDDDVYTYRITQK